MKKYLIFLTMFFLVINCGAEKFEKPGNNGTVSCNTFCEGSQWGKVGKCVSASSEGAELGCDALLPAVGTLNCFCK